MPLLQSQRIDSYQLRRGKHSKLVLNTVLNYVTYYVTN